MKLKTGYCCGAVLAYAVAAGPAWADLTAQDVWSDWHGYLTSVGYEVSASESQTGSTLAISDLVLNMPIEGTGSGITFSADRIELTENGDGTVSVVMPATMPMVVSGTEEGEDYTVQVNIEQTGHAMTASGSPEKLTYAYTAATMAIRMASLMVDGEDMSSAATVEVTMANMASTTTMTIGESRGYSQRMTGDNIVYNFNFDDPDSDDGGVMSGTLAGVAFEGTGNIPAEMNTTDLRQMLEDGFAFDGSFSHTGGETNLNGTDGGDSFQFASTSQGGELRVAMSNTQVVYDISQGQTAINVAGSEIPFPVALEMAKTGFHMLMPVAKSDAEQDFELAITLGDFTMSDMIWGIFDGGGVLPRDPATIMIDLVGKARVLVDFLDPGFAEDMGMSGGMPGEVNALTIRNLLVSAVGTELSGNGDFTFDNTDRQTFNGVPRPSGAVDLKLVGANGLIDNLIQMGFVSDQDAMGARMMMGMLAVPGEGDDTLTSKIEINDEGHIIANGQRIQ